ncbi:retrovirus-related pol polyprotein from transposon TNT 1-94 [Tanacetum coccineum]
MSTQQDIYAASSENHPSMHNKDNYVPWSSRLIRYAKRKPNRKLLTDDELTATEANQVEVDDQVIQTILMGFPEDIYATVDSYNSAKEIWLRVHRRIKGIANQDRNRNAVAARAEGNGNGNNANQIKCYNCRGVGHYARNCIVRPRRRDAAYLQTRKCKLHLNGQFVANINIGYHADKAPVYDSDGSAKDDNNVIRADSSMDPSGGEIEQLPATIEETRAFYESLYNNLVIEVEKVNTVNRETKEVNVKLTAKLARYRGRKKSFEFNQAKFDELENGYRKSVYQEKMFN